MCQASIRFPPALIFRSQLPTQMDRIANTPARLHSGSVMCCVRAVPVLCPYCARAVPCCRPASGVRAATYTETGSAAFKVKLTFAAGYTGAGGCEVRLCRGCAGGCAGVCAGDCAVTVLTVTVL